MAEWIRVVAFETVQLRDQEDVGVGQAFIMVETQGFSPEKLSIKLEHSAAPRSSTNVSPGTALLIAKYLLPK